MASVVSICNRALQRLGSARITDLNEDSTAARECNGCYEALRDTLLRRHPWSFAIKRAQLAASTTAPVFEFKYQYPLPTDNLRILPPLDQYDWQIEGNAIVTSDGGPLNLRYVSQVTDPNAMDVLFREVLSCYMAMAMCERLTQSNQKIQLIKDDLKEIMAEARRTNAFEENSASEPTDDWIQARY